MKSEPYREYLRRQGLPDDVIAKQQAIIRDLNSFFAELGLAENTATAGKAEVEQFARRLIADGRNTLENFSALCDYADWLGQRQLYVALLEVMDCYNALAVLTDKIEERHGRELRGRIFREALPPLGADEGTRSISPKFPTMLPAIFMKPIPG